MLSTITYEKFIIPELCYYYYYYYCYHHHHHHHHHFNICWWSGREHRVLRLKLLYEAVWSGGLHIQIWSPHFGHAQSFAFPSYQRSERASWNVLLLVSVSNWSDVKLRQVLCQTWYCANTYLSQSCALHEWGVQIRGVSVVPRCHTDDGTSLL
jgi:hypothetical protein